MKAIWNNKIIAESGDTIVVEGNHYFPAEAVNKAFFKESTEISTYPWNGKAHYYDLEVDGQTNKNAVWYYPQP